MTSPEPTTHPHSPPSPRQLCVLFVDNHLDTVRVFALYLRHFGITVHTATRGRDALRIARVLRPDVIVLDVAMPGMDGLEVADALKLREETSTIPVVLFTGAARRNEMKARPELWVSKPCAPEEMLRIVRAVGGA